jgi:hypothetical protein
MEKNWDKYNEMVKRINKMSDDDIDKLIKNNECPFHPEFIPPNGMGMFHCKICGEMVLAGVPHPRYEL